LTLRTLVTGVTGFVGREVAHALLAAGRPLIVLARARGGTPAGARVAGALGLGPADERVHVVEGDLAMPGCGVDAAGWRGLRDTVGTVIHCAGDTTFAPERLEPYETAHVDGPRRLLEALAAGRLRRWVHVSTAYVCGRREGLVLESDGDLGQRFHNVYERAKLASEAAVLAAGARAGVDVRIARPGIVVGAAPATDGGAPSNLFFEFVRMTAGLAAAAAGRPVPLRIEAAARAPFNVVPVAYVAAALRHLAVADGGGAPTVHLVARRAPTQAEVLATVAARLGVHGLSLVDRLEHPSPLERRVAAMLRGYRPYLTQDVRFDDASARATLPPDVRRHAALSRPTLHALIDLALTTRGRSTRAAPAAVPLPDPS
jgi:nucleoside-diphosphate-sugar epimerase